ncbi:MAG: hypothetical protein CMP91_00880 [Gammaproteobacteria bacterium]|nr:hypothetical protein [Gammaproteobacteria bacterium]|tara:strand:- start:82763 stop:84064 length:1302 start_codon:yes stop_codon:yes gene_type:complete
MNLVKANTVLVIGTLLLLPEYSQANDIIRIGTGARAGGMVNISGLSRDGLSALSANPAYFTQVEEGVQLNFTAVFVESGFTSSLGEKAKADRGPGFFPDFVKVWNAADSPWSFAAGAFTQSAMRASFEFNDPPGTLGVTYGRQRHESEYIVLNASAAAAYQFSERLSVGVQAGLAYNRNRLEAPYIFQSHPALQGLKVLVDLEADDFSPAFLFGLDYQLAENLGINLSYSPEVDFAAEGDLQGNLSALGLGITPDFFYQAAVETGLPAFFSAGLNWQQSERLELGFQLDWINWASRFAELPIRLSQGNNAGLNGVLGSSSLNDTALLDWDDQFTLHLGGEYDYSAALELRAGYEYSSVAVPQSTMTPLTASVLQHAFSIGASQNMGGNMLDYYYRLSFSAGDENISATSLQGNEYRGTQIDLLLHNIGLTVNF